MSVDAGWDVKMIEEDGEKGCAYTSMNNLRE